jgi:hypothetical protein
VHHDLPNELGDLQPQFLSDNRYFVCPTARRLGLTSADLTEWGASGQTTYDYEFGRNPIPKVMAGGSPSTMREWKQLQMGLIGSDVAMVRCHTHEKASLELSFGGRIYESAGLDWEPNFKDVVDPQDLTFGRCLATFLVQKTIVLPKRAPTTTPDLIDLSEHYNLTLDEVWPGQGVSCPFAALPSGISEFAGTSFDVRGAVQLGAMRPGLVHYPVRVTGIKLGILARTIQLLVGTAHSAAPQALVAEFVFHLANGQQQPLQLHYGTDVSECVVALPNSSPPLEQAKLAWSGATKQGKGVKLYQCCWTNPLPSQIVNSVDFVNREGNAGPLLLAISVGRGP